jgi:hypothetical protein
LRRSYVVIVCFQDQRSNFLSGLPCENSTMRPLGSLTAHPIKGAAMVSTSARASPHVVLVLLVGPTAAQQHEHEGLLSTRASYPRRAFGAFAVLLHELEPAIISIEGNRGLQVADMQGTVSEAGRTGSLMTTRSAPQPVIDPPTSAAKYSPPVFVSHQPAAWLSSANPTPRAR